MSELANYRRTFSPYWGCIGLIVLMTGCHQGFYYAESLPPQYAAPPSIDVQALDLSRLSLPEANSDFVQSGDVLDVTLVSGAVDERPQRMQLRVLDDGTVNIPLVGQVPVAGMDLFGTERAIQDASIRRGIYRAPTVSIGIEERRTNRVTVMGAVKKPGAVDLPASTSDLASALVAAGGLTEDADQVIEIRSPHPRRRNVAGQPRNRLASYAEPTTEGGPADAVRLDLVAATSDANAQGHYLDDGAMVMVRNRPPQYIHVIGLVKRPNQFPLPPGRDLRVLDAIGLAGGRTMSIADKVYVIRNSSESPEPIVIKMSVREAKQPDSRANIALAAGDVVSVEETPTTFILGTARQFVNVGVSARGLFY